MNVNSLTFVCWAIITDRFMSKEGVENMMEHCQIIGKVS